MLRKSDHSGESGMGTSSMRWQSVNYRRRVFASWLIRPERSCRMLTDWGPYWNDCPGRSAPLRDHPPKALIGGRPRSALQLPRGLPRPQHLRKNGPPFDAACWDCPYPCQRSNSWYGSAQSWTLASQRRNETSNRALHVMKNHRSGFGLYVIEPANAAALASEVGNRKPRLSRPILRGQILAQRRRTRSKSQR
jgi:hypothetical protein